MARQFSGPRLRQIRTAAGISSEQLALSIGRSFYSVREYELGRVLPPVNVAAQLAAVLGCTIDDFLSDDRAHVGGAAA